MGEETALAAPGEPEVLKGLSGALVDFCSHYAVSSNAESSARLAGFVGPYGHTLVRNERLQHVIEHFRAVYADASTYNPQKLVRQWAQQASFQPSKLLANDWQVKDLSELTDEERQHFDEALLGFEVIEKSGSRTIKPKFNKQLAQEHLGKLLRLYAEDKEKGGADYSLTVNVNTQINQEVSDPMQELGHISITQDDA